MLLKMPDVLKSWSILGFRANDPLVGLLARKITPPAYKEGLERLKRDVQVYLSGLNRNRHAAPTIH